MNDNIKQYILPVLVAVSLAIMAFVYNGITDLDTKVTKIEVQIQDIVSDAKAHEESPAHIQAQVDLTSIKSDVSSIKTDIQELKDHFQTPR